jgi:hypothetical protein
MHMNFIIKNISFHFTDLGYYMDYSAKVQLENKNIPNNLTSKSCIHLKKDDSFLPGSSG